MLRDTVTNSLLPAALSAILTPTKATFCPRREYGARATKDDAGGAGGYRFKGTSVAVTYGWQPFSPLGTLPRREKR